MWNSNRISTERTQLDLSAIRRGIRAALMLVPLFGLQMMLTIHRPRNHTAEQLHEFVFMLIVGSQVDLRRSKGVPGRSWDLGVLASLKICRRGRSMFWLPKMSYSFIQNCRWIILQVSHHQRQKTCVKNGRQN